MLNFTDVALQFGNRILFNDVNLTIFAKQKVGVIGANGCGKSTFFKLLLQELTPDRGSLHFPKQLIIGHVSQETPNVNCSALEYVLAGDLELTALQQALVQAEQQKDHEQLAVIHSQLADLDAYSATSRAIKLLEGLGFSQSEYQLPVTAFSGGWRMRLNLARVLMRRCDLLLLDEPTNHLDLDAIIWLEKWLKSYTGVLLLISHDREFLDATVGYILHFDHTQLKLYSGNYSNFEQQRANQLATQQAMHAKQQRARAHLQSFVDRFRAKASKAKQAQSRLKALAKMELIAAVQAHTAFNFSFPTPPKSPGLLLQLKQVTIGYGSQPVLQAIDLRLDAGARIGLVGPNGAGKSTLVKLLAGIILPSEGSYQQAKDLNIAYYAQHQLEQLIAHESPLQHLARLAPSTLEQQLRSFLGGFGFSNEAALTPIAQFSGGEKARLALALLVWRKPNLLLLDEPTNHLDLEMRSALTLALQQYTGAVVVVSHDRHLLRTTVDQFMLVADNSLTAFAGDIEDYQLWLTSYKQTGKPVQSQDKQQRKQQRENIKQLKLAIKRVEQAMETYHLELNQMNEQLANPDLYVPAQEAELASYISRQAALQKQLAAAETEWLALSETLEMAG